MGQGTRKLDAKHNGKEFIVAMSLFELLRSKRRVYVPRRIGERMNDKCVAETTKHVGRSVMVWGCFAGDRVGDLVQIEGILKKVGCFV